MTTTFHHPCRLLPRLILCGLIAAAACRALAQPPRSETARDWRRHATAIAAFDADGTPREAMPMHDEMSDAVFMGCPILAQAARLTVEARYADACLRHMRFIQKRCLREDGLYRHSPLDEAAWGRGNGFPALGLCWSLDELPESSPVRDDLLAPYLAHLTALLPHQDASGCWHQVIDRPESYREFTATAMITYALMRGIRAGRLAAEASRAATLWVELKN